MENLAKFYVDESLCTGCGNCVKVCAGGLLSLDERKKPRMKEVTEFGWDGCWKCQHCLAVCPGGAISVLDKKPEDSLLPPDPKQAAPMLDALIANRRSCRRYQDRNVEPEVISSMLEILQNAPTGSNKQLVEYTLIDDKEQTRLFRDFVYKKMEEQAEQGIYAKTFDAKSYGQMKEWEKTVRPDMLLCSAPHILIPHAPSGKGCWVQDVNISCTYFELLCASRGLGAVLMIYPLSVLENMPELKAMLRIPEDHYVGMMVGFGYPELTFSRGVQKAESGRITRLRFEE